MIICFTCNTDTKRQLDRLVESGHYRDHSEAISSAIHNLTVLHSELSGAQSVVIDRSGVALTSEPARQEALEPGTTQPYASERRPAPVPVIPTLLQRAAERSAPVRFADVTIQQPTVEKNLPVELWLFGQFNRLLPTKVTCRALANIRSAGNDRLPLEETALTIANEAAALGRYLLALDQKLDLGRDDATAIAFPKSTAPSELKSIQRFANQFVGAANKQGQLSGLPVALNLVGHNPDYRDGIMLTEPGWRFAMMENPILDTSSKNDTLKFSDEEISFLLDHILMSAPIEALTYQSILRKVANGSLTPDDLDRALSTLSSSRLEPTFVSTQRSGAICRMVDLDLIHRSRIGTRVSYVVVDRGRTFLRSADERFGESR